MILNRVEKTASYVIPKQESWYILKKVIGDDKIITNEKGKYS